MTGTTSAIGTIGTIGTGTTTAGSQAGVTLDDWGDLALLLGLPVALVAVAAVTATLVVARQASSRPRTGGPRVRFAVFRYDFWLDLHGVGRRRRRELRRELHANLVDSAARVGEREALRALGSLRRLAAESASATEDVAEPHRRPRWGPAASAALAALGIVALVELLAAMWWVTAAHDSGVSSVTGSLLLFPSSTIEWHSAADGASVAVQPGWLMLAAAALTFVAVSRPWHLLTRRRAS